MKLMKKLAIILCVSLIAGIFVGCSSSTTQPETESNDTSGEEAISFPEQDIQGTIMWSAGGVNDSVSRAIGPYVEEELGKKIIFTNRPGAAGGISTQYVHDQKADGYNILFGAENPQIAKVMGTSNLDYSNFIPISIFSTSAGVAVVDPDSKYETLSDLVDDILARPGEVTMGTTGAGGLPFTIASMMKDINGTEPQMVAFDGEAGAVAAVMGGHVDYTIVTIGSAAEALRAGKVKGLAVFHNEVIEGLEDVPLIEEMYPEYSKYMPWGPFYGAFVKEGTPQEVVDILTAAFEKAVANPDYQKVLKDLGNIPSGISGQEAREFIDKYRSVTSWIMYDTGSAKHSPEEFGIERPAN